MFPVVGLTYTKTRSKVKYGRTCFVHMDLRNKLVLCISTELCYKTSLLGSQNRP